MIAPSAARSSSPRPPSVIVKTTVLPVIVAGSTYQPPTRLAGVGPYFQYCVPAGSAFGYVTVKASVEPGVQFTVVKAKRPWGKPIEPGGTVGGSGAAPGGDPMNCCPENEQVGPPPVNWAVMLPVPVPEAAVKVVTTAPTEVDEVDAVLFAGKGSALVDTTLAVFVIVAPLAMAAPALKTNVNDADAPEASVAIVQVTVPDAPAAGLVQVNAGPLFCARETKVVPGGSTSVSVTPWAMPGPLFATVTE